MIKVRIIAVGKLKEKFFLEAAGEYEKRLKAFCELQTVEIKPYALPENPSESEINTALKEEALKISEKIPKGAAVFPLVVEGKSLSSEELALKTERLINDGQSICFIIGGSYGLSSDIKRLGEGISFSKMTFPHRLFRIMLLEQIYRSFTIISGKKYHK